MADPSKSWKFRAVQHCKGCTTKLGALIVAMQGIKPSRPPYYDPQGCVIDLHGRVLVKVWTRDGKCQGAISIAGTTQWLRDEFNRLADELKFSDAERTALFTEFQKWIVKDYRATSNHEVQ